MSVSCSTISSAGKECFEAYADEPLVDHNAPGFVNQTFGFSMTASVEDDQGISDSIDSDWVGTFMMDDGGVLHGTGAAACQAAISNAKDGCGCLWEEDGGFDFEILGEALHRGDGITFWFGLDLASEATAVRGNPDATCDDPGTWRTETPDMYFDIRVDLPVESLWE